MTVEKFLARQKMVIACRPEDTVQAAAMLLSSNKIGAMPVRDEAGRLVGILSERDIVQAFATRPAAEIMSLHVSDLMSRDPVTCRPTDTMLDAMQIMTRNRFRHLPVVDDEGQVVGMLSIRDALEAKLRDAELEAGVLRDSFLAARVR